MRAKNYADKATIIEAIIESKELCLMFCKRVEFRVMQIELNSQLDKIDELPIFVKYYQACQGEARKFLSLNNPTE